VIQQLEEMMQNIRLDYISCVLTVVSALLIGKKLWQGWIIAGINSAVVCLIGMRTAQFGFIPANLFCIVLYSRNFFTWREQSQQDSVTPDSPSGK
jgi:hypothetical protein